MKPREMRLLFGFVVLPFLLSRTLPPVVSCLHPCLPPAPILGRAGSAVPLFLTPFSSPSMAPALDTRSTSSDAPRLTALPYDVMLAIAQHLAYLDVYSLSQVCYLTFCMCNCVTDSLLDLPRVA
jgi:hypothetical protein